jgi:hypothetical protein
MKIGVSLSILAQAGRSDVAVYKEHLELGDLAEPLGFDSIFALEHHFTGYSMSPAPVQLLSYFAGRTKRVALGTAVIVLPWHDPSASPRASRCWMFCAVGGACSASAVARPRWNTPASAFRWRRHARASSKRLNSSAWR